LVLGIGLSRKFSFWSGAFELAIQPNNPNYFPYLLPKPLPILGSACPVTQCTGACLG